MKDSERTMIEARRNLTQKVMQEGKSEAEILKALRNLKYEPLITEIHNAENAMKSTRSSTMRTNPSALIRSSFL